ncbi:MAG: hypothetical protein ACQETI_13290 [Halobacteriota archaeon]
MYLLRLLPESTVVPGLMALVVLAGFGIFVSILYTEHRKEVALIEAGVYGEPEDDLRAWILALGLLLVAVGLADIVTAALSGAVPDNGVPLAFVGVAALAYYYFTCRESSKSQTTVESEV